MLGSTAVLLTWLPFLSGHVVPDDVVYRGIQVIVQTEGIEIRYQLGQNEKTLRHELARREKPGTAIPADDEAALARYRDVMLPVLVAGLQCAIDGRSIPLQPVRAELLRQHHAQIECLYQGSFRAGAKPSRLELVDNNFAEVPGAHILALKGRGPIDVLQCDAPLLLVRAPVKPFEATDTTIPDASARRLEAFFCRAEEARALAPAAPSISAPAPRGDAVRPSDDAAPPRVQGGRGDVPDAGSNTPADTESRSLRDNTRRPEPAILADHPWPWWVAGAVLGLLIAGLGWWFSPRRETR